MSILDSLFVAPNFLQDQEELLHFLPTGSEEREVLGVGSIPIAILPSCQYIKTIALQGRDIDMVG